MTAFPKSQLVGLIMCGMLSIGAGQSHSGKSDKKPESVATLSAAINSLKAPNVIWRKIAWRSCLLDGLQQARAQKKPALLWVFIDRPADDARC